MHTNIHKYIHTYRHVGTPTCIHAIRPHIHPSRYIKRGNIIREGARHTYTPIYILTYIHIALHTGR